MEKEKIGFMQDLINKAVAEIIEDESIISTLTIDSDLINDVGLDSIELVTMILNLEDELDVVIEFDDFDFDETTTIGKLAEYLQGLKDEQ